jgi:anti-sigma factor RsiW
VLGKLEAAEAEAFAAHLSGCAECRRQSSSCGPAQATGRTAPATPLPEGLRDRTLAAVRQAATRH